MKSISIITPSYNRAHLLENAYNSLKKQTSNDFEWIVVDDGSKDNTEEVVNKFISEKEIDIVFVKKENGGKHTAVNAGVKKAKGKLILILDSDDVLTDDAIETIAADWKEYEQQEEIGGLSYNRKITNLEIKQKAFPSEKVISNHIEFRYNQGFLKDRVEVYRTDVMKKFPFPKFEGERFLSEAVVWNKIAYDYKTVYIDKDIYECEYLEGGLTSNSIKTRVNNPKGAMANYEIMMKKPFNAKLRFKYSILYNTFSKFAGVPFKERMKENKCLMVITKPLGDFVYYKWKKYLNK